MPADLGLTGLFLVNLVVSYKSLISTDKQETFGDNNEAPLIVERLTDQVAFMLRLKHCFIGSSFFFIFTHKLSYSCLQKTTKLVIIMNKC